ncbi:MAG TPA: YihY/virulence factor BrkB family protein [Candidatus Kapabacteria bacterium]|nr:YihY/virulence factor BrkB family protein [Candidatus Kapabacteria bacterium]
MSSHTPLTVLRTRAHLMLRRLQWLWRNTVTIGFRADEDHVFLLAAGIAFNIIIAMIPTLLILLFVLGYVFDSERILQQINEYIRNFVVAEGYRDDLIVTLRAQIESLVANRGLAGLIGIVGLLWTGSALATSIRVSINKVLRCREVRSYLIYKLFDISTIAVIGLLVFVSIVMGTLYQIVVSRSSWLVTSLDLPGVEGFLPELVAVVVSFVLFLVIFRYMPYQKQERHIIWIGAISSTVLWELARLVFRFYLGEFTTFSRIYGAYAFFASAIFWLYYSALVFLLGAEVAYHVKQSRWNARRLFNRIATSKVVESDGAAIRVTAEVGEG